MKKLITGILLFVLSMQGVAAQNNPYELDDACYPLFQRAELLVGKEGFDSVNEALLEKALEKGDTKAQTLYYVERLKNVSALKRAGQVFTPEDDAQVLQAMEDVKRVASELGYSQYYYYAYDLTQNYFYNTGRQVRTFELVKEMREDAIARGEEYGIWMGNRYLISLYIAQNDYISAKKYIVASLEMYENTEDETIRRQSATRLYCDLADTYPIGHDSVSINIRKAELQSRHHLDSLRCTYLRAKLEAYQKNIPAYERDRDICRQDPSIRQISSTAGLMFDNIDQLVYGKPAPEIKLDGMMSHLREVKYIANIAEEYGYKDLAFEIEKRLVAYDETVLAKANQSKLTEIEAKLGNDVLSAQVDEAAGRAIRSRRLVISLVISILVVIILFFVIYSLHLRRTNEKVRLADAAKTRFVQNMSHEVRTPLNAIVGFSQLLSLPDGSFPEEEKQEFAGHIVNNTKMLTMLLDDILHVSAMDSGNYRITYEDGEMHYMAQAAISSAEHRLKPGVRMYYDPETTEPHTFITDPHRVQQILINLLTNACKHTTEGEIRLTSSLTQNPGFVTYAIEDTGSGIPPEQADTIFVRFTKLNDFVQGMGLGLSICRDIAQRMNARVYLDTTYTGGARFVLELPRVPDNTTMPNS
ncbi:MAG: HAMP domain-containing histidine kinase [Bacteroidales bacterium]|nr:HAMP domain-containing histidine kinase [Bacteroidales bacterium]